jgi:hypothetical protein
MNDLMLNNFAVELISTERPMDPSLTRRAREWYENFTGSHAVKIADVEVVELYLEIFPS